MDEDETKPADLLAYYAMVMARAVATMTPLEASEAFDRDAPAVRTAAHAVLEWRERHPYGTV